jgi:putative two-component system response regulator
MDHTTIGHQIVHNVQFPWPQIPEIVRWHHERADGSGYPDGLRGAEIPVTAAILQLADVYDALTTNRPYRKASPSEVALQIMEEEAGRGWWNRDLLNAFREMIRSDFSASAPRKIRKVAR